MLLWPSKIVEAGEKGPKTNLKSFRHSNYYLTFASQKGVTIVVTASFFQTQVKKVRVSQSIEMPDKAEAEQEKLMSNKPV